MSEDNDRLYQMEFLNVFRSKDPERLECLIEADPSMPDSLREEALNWDRSLQVSWDELEVPLPGEDVPQGSYREPRIEGFKMYVMRRQGFLLREIASEFGVDTRTVTRKLKKAQDQIGWPLPRGKPGPRPKDKSRRTQTE